MSSITREIFFACFVLFCFFLFNQNPLRFVAIRFLFLFFFCRKTAAFVEFTDFCFQRTLGNDINIYKYKTWDKSCWFSWRISLIIVLCFKFHYDITHFIRIFFLEHYNAAQLSHCFWTIENHTNIQYMGQASLLFHDNFRR